MSAKFFNVFKRCEIKKIAQFGFIFSNKLIVKFSVFLSIAEVASSSIKNCGFLYKTLAKAIICFCPPDKLIPSSPSIVDNP